MNKIIIQNITFDAIINVFVPEHRIYGVRRLGNRLTEVELYNELDARPTIAQIVENLHEANYTATIR